VNQAQVGAISVALPPLAEQARIVDVMRVIDSAIKALTLEAHALGNLRMRSIAHLLSQGASDGWEAVTVADLADINPEAVSKKAPPSQITYIDIASVSPDGVDRGALKSLPYADAPSRAQRIVRAGDVIISTVRPYLRARGHIPSDLDGHVASTGFAVLRATERCLPGYLNAITATDQFYAHLESRQSGSAYPAVRPSDIGDARVFLAPRPMQEKVAQLLESLELARSTAQDRVAILRKTRIAMAGVLMSGRRSLPTSYDRFLADENPDSVNLEPATV
jgi:type I restriction enzyme S subunit